MRVPAGIFTAEGGLLSGSISAPSTSPDGLAEELWHRTAVFPSWDIKPWGTCKALSPEELRVLGVCLEVKPWREGANWGPLGWALHGPCSHCTSREELSDFPKLPKRLIGKAKPDVRILTLGLSGLGTSQLFERADVLRSRLGLSVQAREEREEGGKREIMQQL